MRLGISSFDLGIKFDSREEAYKYAKRLIEFIRYTCKKNADKGWIAQAMVCISNTKGKTTSVYYEHNGKVGRPKKEKEVFFSYRNACLELKWHLHILLVSKPMYAFMDEIKEYIDNKWVQKIKDKNIDTKNTYKRKVNIRIIEYFISQSDNVLFCNCNYTNDIVIPRGYSLKKLYNAYMKSRTALRYAKSVGTKKRLKLEEKYYEIMDYYWSLTREDDKKKSNEYMKEVRRRKIAENYERINKNNKVQKDLNISRRRIVEDDGF